MATGSCAWLVVEKVPISVFGIAAPASGPPTDLTNERLLLLNIYILLVPVPLKARLPDIEAEPAIFKDKAVAAGSRK